MADLLSPGVQVTLTDESYYAPGTATCIPLFFIATADEKTQTDGVTPALGTYEHGVLRTVTSVSQSLQLYGNPKFWTDANGNPQHGDSRNEYGLEALNKFLQVGDLAYVVRANVNLNDDLEDIKNLWEAKIQDTGDLLSSLIAAYITQYNTANNLVPSDTNYKLTVTGTELKSLVNEALSDLFAEFSFSTQEFQNAFLLDHSVPQAGYQDVQFDTTGGYLQTSDVTGLVSNKTYGANIQVTSSSGTTVHDISLTGSQAVTFGTLISTLNTQLNSTATVQLLNGILRITSTLDGVTSGVDIIVDGPSGTLPLFSSLNLYKEIAEPIPGVGAGALDVYDSTYSTIVSSYDGLDSLIDVWSSGNVVSTQFTPAEAEGLLLNAATSFEGTKEFMVDTSLGANDAAKRAQITKQLKAIINDPSTGVTSDALLYNVVACPGYFECDNDLVTLSQTMREEVFVVGDVPFDKAPTGPAGMTVWASSAERVSNYLISYQYPHGLTDNIDGSTIMAASSSTMLRTLAYNDSVGELWYAPAGATRGICPQLSDIGYVSGTLGTATEFVSEQLNQGDRDALYAPPININPITYLTGRGILVFGQKTSNPKTQATDRINVVRLCCYIRRTVRNLAFPFLFEPNDAITRTNVKFAMDSFLTTLVDRRGLYDFLTVCDETINTPTTIDENKLICEIYIKPTRDIEFIMIPIVIVNTGASLTPTKNTATQSI